MKRATANSPVNEPKAKKKPIGVDHITYTVFPTTGDSFKMTLAPDASVGDARAVISKEHGHSTLSQILLAGKEGEPLGRHGILATLVPEVGEVRELYLVLRVVNHDWRFTTASSRAGTWDITDNNHTISAVKDVEKCPRAFAEPTFFADGPECSTIDVLVVPAQNTTAFLGVHHFTDSESMLNANNAKRSGSNYKITIRGDGCIYGATAVAITDDDRPVWSAGDRLRILFNSGSRTVSYWHNGTLIFEDATFVDAGKIEAGDRLCFFFSSSLSSKKVDKFTITHTDADGAA